MSSTEVQTLFLESTNLRAFGSFSSVSSDWDTLEPSGKDLTRVEQKSALQLEWRAGIEHWVLTSTDLDSVLSLTTPFLAPRLSTAQVVLWLTWLAGKPWGRCDKHQDRSGPGPSHSLRFGKNRLCFEGLKLSTCNLDPPIAKTTRPVPQDYTSYVLYIYIYTTLSYQNHGKGWLYVVTSLC